MPIRIKRFSCPVSFFTLSTILLLPLFAQADEKSGRLPDGRAFRVDANGDRLVDHLAELEVQVADLERQVATLESALKAKGKSIPAVAPLPEAPKQVASCEEQNETIRTLQADIASLKMRAQSQQVASSNNADVRALREEVRLQQDSVEVSIARENELRKALEESKSEFASLKGDLVALQEENLQLEKAKKQAERLALDLQDSSTEVQRAYQIVEEKQAELHESEKRVARLENQLEKMNAQVAQLQAASDRPVAFASRTSEKPAVTRTRLSKSTPTEKEVTLSQDDIVTAKRELNQKLSHIQNLILKRKSLLDTSKQRRSNVSVSIQVLETKQGTSLDTLRSRVAKLNASSDVDGISKGLDAIVGLLDEDISVLSRLASR